jgi:hypothetical protein
MCVKYLVVVLCAVLAVTGLFGLLFSVVVGYPGIDKPQRAVCSIAFVHEHEVVWPSSTALVNDTSQQIVDVPSWHGLRFGRNVARLYVDCSTVSLKDRDCKSGQHRPGEGYYFAPINLLPQNPFFRHGSEAYFWLAPVSNRELGAIDYSGRRFPEVVDWKIELGKFVVLIRNLWRSIDADPRATFFFYGGPRDRISFCCLSREFCSLVDTSLQFSNLIGRCRSEVAGGCSLFLQFGELLPNKADHLISLASRCLHFIKLTTHCPPLKGCNGSIGSQNDDAQNLRVKRPKLNYRFPCILGFLLVSVGWFDVKLGSRYWGMLPLVIGFLILVYGFILLFQFVAENVQ